MQAKTILRSSFNQEAKLYNKARPNYPEELIESLVDETNLSGQSKLLEIGPGTGQATVSLAKRGYTILAVELGSNLAVVASHNLRNYQNAKVLIGAFENASLPSSSFDLVYAATALHWIKPAMRYSKPHQLLKDYGHMAVIHTTHIYDEPDRRFFDATQPIYDKYFSPSKPLQLLKSEDVKPTQFDDKFFQLSYFGNFPLTVEYNAQEYVELLGTFSPNLVLPIDVRNAFFNEIHQLIDMRFNGKVSKRFIMSLTIGKKV